MKKVELQELIQDFLTGGDAPSDVKGRYHDEIILNHMENAFNAIVFKTWLEAKNYSDYSVLDSWAKNYTVPITGDVAALPFPPIQLPDNRGILQVAPATDLTNPFAYLETNSQGVWAELEASIVLLNPSFYLEQNSTVSDWILANGYWNSYGFWYGGEYWIEEPTDNINTHQLVLANIPSGVESLLVKMIVPLEQLDLYDEVSIPAGKEKMMVQSVIELLRNKRKGPKTLRGKVNSQLY